MGNLILVSIIDLFFVARSNTPQIGDLNSHVKNHDMHGSNSFLRETLADEAEGRVLEIDPREECSSRNHPIRIDTLIPSCKTFPTSEPVRVISKVPSRIPV